MNFVMPNFTTIIPEMTVLGMLCVILIVDLFLNDRTRGITYVLTQLTIIAVAILSFLQLGAPTLISFNNSVIRDDLGSVLTIFVDVLMFFSLLYARHYNRSRKLVQGEFYLLILASLVGMMVMISGYSFISIYIGIELLSLPLYALIALRKDSSTAPEAAIKYFVTGALASGMLLYGLSLLYGISGSLNVSVVAAAMQTTPLHIPALLGMIFVVIGLMFKLGVVPFHMWVPDVYQGAPMSVTAIIASAPKIAAFAIMIRLLTQALPAMQMDWQQLLILAAILSMLIGNLLAIAQTNIKRLFAYSSIAQMGYVMLGFIAGTPESYAAAMFYVIVYAITALGAFGLLMALAKEGLDVEYIEELRGLNTRHPWFAFLMLVLLFSMAGVPPAVGFFAKLGVIQALIAGHLVWLACLAVLFSVIGVYYYIHVIKVMYFEEPTDQSVIQVPVDAWVAVSVNALVILLLGFFPGALITLCQQVFT